MSEKNPKVDAYLSRATKWRSEMEKLRELVLECPFTEELKWGKPCYAYEGTNIVLIIGFKDYCSYLFCKGALLKDPAGILVKAGENTQAARQARFTDIGDIVKNTSTLRAYLREAIEAEKAGLQVTYLKSTDLKYPEEFQRKLDQDQKLKAAFEALTPGRRRAYNIYFSQPKQSKTRVTRIEKCIPQILSGKGMND